MAMPMKRTKIVLGSLMLITIIVFTYQGSFPADLETDQLVVIRDSGTTLTKPEVLTKENMTEIEHIFMQRRSSLTKWCSKKRNVDFINYKYSKLILQGYDWMHIPEYKLFYCSIPKAGSTTMKDILMKSIGVERNTAELHDQAADVLSMDELRGRASPLNIPLARARRNPFYPEKQPSHSLIIVRNPWKRLVSSYQNKIIQNGHPLINYCREYPPAKANYKQSSFNTTFSEFVNCVLSNYLLDLPFFDDHLFPMNKLCGICLIQYDMIGKNSIKVTAIYRYICFTKF